MVKGIIFDLDGTIGDTLPLCIKAFRNSIEKISGVKISDEEIMSNFGPSEEGIIKTILKEKYEQGVKEYLINYEKFHHMSPNPFEGMVEVFDYLKNKSILLGIVTGKGMNSTKITLDKYGIYECFDVIETGSPNGPIKKEGIKNIMLKYGLSSEEIIYIGDSVSDISDAKDLKVPVYAAAWAKSANYDELIKNNPDEIFTNIQSFKEYIKNIL